MLGLQVRVPHNPCPHQNLLFHQGDCLIGAVFSPHGAAVFWEYPSALPFLFGWCQTQRCILRKILYRLLPISGYVLGSRRPMTPRGIFSGPLVESSKHWAHVRWRTWAIVTVRWPVGSRSPLHTLITLISRLWGMIPSKTNRFFAQNGCISGPGSRWAKTSLLLYVVGLA